MKFVSRRVESTTVPLAPAGEGFSGLLRDWAQSLYDLAHDPSHCSRCGVYLPAQNRICDPCAHEADRFSDQ